MVQDGSLEGTGIGALGAQRGDDEPGIGSLGQVLRLDHRTSRPAPALAGAAEAAKEYEKGDGVDIVGAGIACAGAKARDAIVETAEDLSTIGSAAVNAAREYHGSETEWHSLPAHAEQRIDGTQQARRGPRAPYAFGPPDCNAQTNS